MRFFFLLAAAFLAGCATASDRRPVTLVNNDGGGLVGSWRGPFTLSTMISDQKGALTYAAASGCVVSQGVLRPLGKEHFKVERYQGGYASDACGELQPGPAVAPFDGPEVLLRRSGTSLLVRGGRVERTLVRDTLADLIVPAEALLGRWLLAEAGKPLSAARGASLTLDGRGYTFRSACGTLSGNGLHTAPGLILRLGGNLYQRTTAECRATTRGDRLPGAAERAEWRYLPARDRLEIRLGRERFEFVRG